MRTAWVAVEGDGSLVLVDLDDGAILRRHAVAGGPHNLAVAPDGTVAATLYAADAVAIVDPDGELRRVVLGGRPHDVKPVGDGFVVANETGRSLDVLTAGGDVVRRIDLGVEPHDLAVTPDGATAWVTVNGSDELVEADLAELRVRRRVSTGVRPHDLRIGDDGRIWVTDWSGPLHVFDPAGGLLTSLELGREAHHLAFSPAGDRLWLVDHATRRAFVIDTVTVAVVDEVAIPGAPHHVTLSGDGALAAVADHTNGAVAVYDARDPALVVEIPVGAGPHGIWAAPTG